MTTQETQALPLSVRDALIWLQEQMTELRDLAARLQQEGIASLSRLATLDERVDQAHDRLAAADRDRNTIARLQDEVRETHELASQLQDRFSTALLRAQEAD